MERNLKEERKRIRQEIKDGVKHMKKSFEPLKELTDADRANEDEYEDDDVKVKIVELSTGDLAAQRNLLGENRAQESEDSDVEKDSDDEDVTQSTNCIPGMDFDINAKRKRKSTTAADCENDENNEDGKPLKKKSKNILGDLDIKSKKELDHFKKTKTMKKLKKSKAFKMKERLDKQVNLKKARKDKNNTLKSIPKHLRKKKKFEKNPYSKGRKLNKRLLRKKYENK